MRVEDYKIQRYTLSKNLPKTSDLYMREDTDGGWVRWESVEPLIKAYLSLTNTVNESELINDEVYRLARERVNRQRFKDLTNGIK